MAKRLRINPSHFCRATVLGSVLLGWTVVPAWSGDWAIDTTTTCRVWNPHPQLNETIKWSGACVNGFAQGLGSVRWIRNGALFETDEGEWHEGYQIGKGTQVWPTGRYEGGFVASEPHGQGIFVLQTSRYEGELRNGKPNGAGTLTTPEGSFQGNWTDGCLQTAAKNASFGVPSSACR
jgi:MORN repeat